MKKTVLTIIITSVFLLMCFIIFILFLLMDESILDESPDYNSVESDQEVTINYYEQYLDCRYQAYESYDSRWDSTCTSQLKEEGCSLSGDLARSYDKTLNADIDFCVVRFSDKIPNDEFEYNKCLDSAYEDYISEWNGYCELLDLSVDCQLPSERATLLDEDHTKEKQRCLQLFQ